MELIVRRRPGREMSPAAVPVSKASSESRESCRFRRGVVAGGRSGVSVGDGITIAEGDSASRDRFAADRAGVVASAGPVHQC